MPTPIQRMHHALEIPEIILNIFGHCRLPGESTGLADIAVLARTCRAFKEPALDVLWEELLDPSALARCIPEASRLSSQKPRVRLFIILCLIANAHFSLLGKVFVEQSAYTERVGYTSELHASHQINACIR